VAAALLILFFAAAVVLLSARPAAAHDSLISSDPANGATVDTLPTQLTLSFSAALLSDDGGTVVEVTDAEGTPLADGSPTVDQNVVTQPLAGPATGTVTVLWRVVSSDGHPVSGEYTFTVSGTATPEPSASPSASSTASASTSSEPIPTQTPLVTTTTDDGAPSPLPWIVGGIIVVVVVVVIIALLAARARHGKDTAITRTAGREHPRDR
jgi:methionine-rich copper-binding protein CopC